MSLTEQQEGRLAAFLALLDTDEARQEAAQAIQQQDPALYHKIFTPGFSRGQEKVGRKAEALQRELDALKGTRLPADREVALRTEADQLRAALDRERHERVEAEVSRAAEQQLGQKATTWVANEVAAAWRTGTLSFDANGEVEVQGIAPAAGESKLAAYTRTLVSRCPQDLAMSRADRGAGTAGDRGAGARSIVEKFMAETQAARDARHNPLMPSATGASPLAASGPVYASPADAALLVGKQLLLGQMIEAGRAAPASSPTPRSQS